MSDQLEDEENNTSLLDTAGYHDCILMLKWPPLPLLSCHILHPVTYKSGDEIFSKLLVLLQSYSIGNNLGMYTHVCLHCISDELMGVAITQKLGYAEVPVYILLYRGVLYVEVILYSKDVHVIGTLDVAHLMEVSTKRVSVKT